MYGEHKMEMDEEQEKYVVRVTLYCSSPQVAEQSANNLDAAIRKANIPFDMEVTGPNIANERYTFTPPVTKSAGL